MARLTAATLLVAATVAGPTFTRVAAAATGKITICHRTHSTTNPYRKITVSQNAITRNHGHGDHDEVDAGNPPVFSSTFSYAANKKTWADVIPGGDAEGRAYNGSNSIALNWTSAGKTIFFSAACAGMTAKQFYDVEIAAGVPEVDVLADLNSQGANEDIALLAALGGSFTGGNLGSWESAVSVATDAATSVTSTTATLNGTLTVGTTSTAPSFEYSTSSSLASPTTIEATPTPVTGTNAAVTAALSSLTPSTTYWFRVVGTTNGGSDTEGVLNGEIRSFRTADAEAPVEEDEGGDGDAPIAGDAPIEDDEAGDDAEADEEDVPAEEESGAAGDEAAEDGDGDADLDDEEDAESVDEVDGGAPDDEVAAELDDEVDGGAPDDEVAAELDDEDDAATVDEGDGGDDPEDDEPGDGDGADDGSDGDASRDRDDESDEAEQTGADDAAAEERPVDDGAAHPAVTPAADGTIRGVVWFDRNHNGIFDGREWVLPGVAVTLQGPPTASGPTTKMRNALVAAAVPSTATAITDADGAYLFEGLEPGSYQVAATATIRGFDYTSDTDGEIDWVVRLPVKTKHVGIADFAGLGRGQLVGQMFEITTGEGMPLADVTCVWGGYDDVLGTGDDVPMSVVAGGDGSFDMEGVPYGRFSCSGADAKGRTSSKVAADVVSPDPVEALLPVGSPVASERERDDIDGELPRTGTDTPLFAIAGGVLIAAGAAMVRRSGHYDSASR